LIDDGSEKHCRSEIGKSLILFQNRITGALWMIQIERLANQFRTPSIYQL